MSEENEPLNTEIVAFVTPTTASRFAAYVKDGKHFYHVEVELALRAYLDQQSRPNPLKAARVAHGLSAQDVARSAGVSQRNLYRWEGGTHIPDPEQAAALAPVLGFASGDEVRRACTLWRALQGTGSDA